MRQSTRRHFLQTSCAIFTGLSAGISGCSTTLTQNDQQASPTQTKPPDEHTTVPPTTPSPVATSEYSDLQSAIDSAGTGDTILIDEDHTIPEHINLKSNIKIFGDGGTVRLADNSSSGSMFRMENVENVWLDGVHVDGNREAQSNSGGGLIGGVRLDTVSNLRITNCLVENAYSNGILIGDRTPGEGTFSDIYIANNRVVNCRRHGIVLGVKNSPGSIYDVVIENNHVRNFDMSIGITVYGASGVDVSTVAILGNTCQNTMGRSNDTAIAFEEQVHHCIAYGNTVDMWGRGSVNGIACTKEANHCIIGNNQVRNSRDGLGVFNFQYHQPDGPPRWNLVTHNDVRACRSGFAYRHLDGDLVVYRNHLQNNLTNVNNQGNNSGDNYYFEENGPTVPTDGTGTPESIGSDVTYTGPDGTELGSARWTRGSFSPDDPVTVEVETTE